MGDIVHFKRPKPSETHKGKGLCQHGHHKWEASGRTPFDVKQGKLVTRYICTRCGAIQSEKR
jgi:hypothetical protein